ncbi:hypothetical protein BV20DRAFT_383373 [Pilatotrama ljubarskyi]|nr:hypothetical protein BV20DRAFT_383373 [Pilatotrama ljubarskyi]
MIVHHRTWFAMRETVPGPEASRCSTMATSTRRLTQTGIALGNRKKILLSGESFLRPLQSTVCPHLLTVPLGSYATHAGSADCRVYVRRSTSSVVDHQHLVHRCCAAGNRLFYVSLGAWPWLADRSSPSSTLSGYSGGGLLEHILYCTRLWDRRRLDRALGWLASTQIPLP